MVERSFSIRVVMGLMPIFSTEALVFSSTMFQVNVTITPDRQLIASKMAVGGGGTGASSSCTGSVNDLGLDFGKIEFLTPFLRACSQCSQNANLRSPQDVWKFSRPARAIGQF